VAGPRDNPQLRKIPIRFMPKASWWGALTLFSVLLVHVELQLNAHLTIRCPGS
jgi:hypothetical protein